MLVQRTFHTSIADLESSCPGFQRAHANPIASTICHARAIAQPDSRGTRPGIDDVRCGATQPHVADLLAAPHHRSLSSPANFGEDEHRCGCTLPRLWSCFGEWAPRAPIRQNSSSPPTSPRTPSSTPAPGSPGRRKVVADSHGALEIDNRPQGFTKDPIEHLAPGAVGEGGHRLHRAAELSRPLPRPGCLHAAGPAGERDGGVGRRDADAGEGAADRLRELVPLAVLVAAPSVAQFHLPGPRHRRISRASAGTPTPS